MSIIYDPHQTNLENIQTKELVKVKGNKHKILFSSNGPFYTDSVKVYNGDTELKLYDQYEIVYTYCKAVLRTARYISGGIWIKDTTLTGPFYLTYHPIGINSVTNDILTKHIANVDATKPYSRYWDDIVGDLYFPPVNIQFNQDFIGEKELMDYLSIIATSLSSKYSDEDRFPYYLHYMDILIDNLNKAFENSPAHAHLNDKSNPHRLNIFHFNGLYKNSTVINTDKVLNKTLDETVNYILSKSDFPIDKINNLLKNLGDKEITGTFTPDTYLLIAKGVDKLDSFLGFDDSITTVGTSGSVNVNAANVSFVDSKKEGLTLDSENGLLFLGKKLITKENVDTYKPAIINKDGYHIDDTDTVKFTKMSENETYNIDVVVKSSQYVDEYETWTPSSSDLTHVRFYYFLKEPLENPYCEHVMKKDGITVKENTKYSTAAFGLCMDLKDTPEEIEYLIIAEKNTDNNFDLCISFVEEFGFTKVYINVDDFVYGNISPIVKIVKSINGISIYGAFEYQSTNGRKTTDTVLLGIVDETVYDIRLFNNIGKHGVDEYYINNYTSTTVNDANLKKSSSLLNNKYSGYAAEPNAVVPIVDAMKYMVPSDKASINGKKLIDNPVLTKSDFGLSNVSNISDIDLPLSSKSEEAFNNKSIMSHGHDWSEIIPEGTESVKGLVYLSDNVTDINKALNSSKIYGAVTKYFGLKKSGINITNPAYGVFVYGSGNGDNIEITINNNLIILDKKNCFINGVTIDIPSSIFNINDYKYTSNTTGYNILYVYVVIDSKLTSGKYALCNCSGMSKEHLFEIGSIEIFNDTVSNYDIKQIFSMYNFSELSMHDDNRAEITNPETVLSLSDNIEISWLYSVNLENYNLNATDSRCNYDDGQKSSEPYTLYCDLSKSGFTIPGDDVYYIKHVAENPFSGNTYEFTLEGRKERVGILNFTLSYSLEDIFNNKDYFNSDSTVYEYGKIIPLFVNYSNIDYLDKMISNANYLTPPEYEDLNDYNSRNGAFEYLKANSIFKNSLYKEEDFIIKNDGSDRDRIYYSQLFHLKLDKKTGVCSIDISIYDFNNDKTLDRQTLTYTNVIFDNVENKITDDRFKGKFDTEYEYSSYAYKFTPGNILYTNHDGFIDAFEQTASSIAAIRYDKNYIFVISNDKVVNRSINYIAEDDMSVIIRTTSFFNRNGYYNHNNFTLKNIYDFGDNVSLSKLYNYMYPINGSVENTNVIYSFYSNDSSDIIPLFIFTNNKLAYNSIINGRTVPFKYYAGAILHIDNKISNGNNVLNIEVRYYSFGSYRVIAEHTVTVPTSEKQKITVNLSADKPKYMYRLTFTCTIQTTEKTKRGILDPGLDDAELFKYQMINADSDSLRHLDGYSIKDELDKLEYNNSIKFDSVKTSTIDFIDNFSILSLLRYDEQKTSLDNYDYDTAVELLPKLTSERLNGDIVELDKDKIMHRFNNGICKRLYKNIRGLQK